MSKKKTQETPVTMPEKVYNFCSKKKMILGILIAVAVVLVAGIIIRGVHLAIEFKGGTLITYTYQGDINTNDVETAVKEVINTSIVVRTGESLDTGGKQLTISFTSEEGLTADRQTELTDALRNKFADADLEIYDSNDVSPSSGREFLLKCLIAVIFAAIMVIIYIAIRFRKIGGWSAGVCSIFALCFDILVAMTTTIVFGFEFNSNIVAVILTILGYSINNTIVIFDRVRENSKGINRTHKDLLVDKSVTETLTRTINTSVTTLVSVLALYVLGVDSIREFILPIIVGIVAGTWSSVTISGSLWYDMLHMGKKSK